MQLTNIKQIIKNIDRIIYHALNSGYNKNTKNPSFSSADVVQPNEQKILFSTDYINIIISSQKSVLPVSKIEYRIPQTRIYITYLQNEDYFIRLIQHFDLTIVITEYFHTNSHQVVEVGSKKDALNVQHPKNYDIIDNYVKVSKDDIFIAQISDKIIIDLIELPNHFKQLIDDELQLHPISIFQTEKTEFLSKLDRNWALIKVIGKKNKIDSDELFKNDILNLIWIQEIYFNFGWFDQLKMFYEEISQVEVSLPNMKIIAIALNRYNGVCNLIGRECVQLEPNQKISHEDHPEKFLNHLARSTDQQHDNIYELIQSEWNYLHIPAIRLKFQKLIHENPDEFFAFAYLTLQHRFWWYDNLEDIILKYLPDEKKVFFKILSLINKFNIVRFNKDSVYFSRYIDSSITQRQITMSNLINKKDTIRGKERYSCLEKDKLFFIKINKCIDFEYTPKSARVNIRPQLFNPDKKNRSECIIVISDFSLNVPLIWDQFAIEFNKCRLKFLRKKDRFQITIKLAKSVPNIKLNEDQIENTFKPVIKYYIPIKRVKSETDISAYNVYGAKIKSSFSNSDIVLFKGNGYNSFGVLNSNFRIQPEKQKKSYNLDLNVKANRQFLICKDNLNLTLTASKFDPVKLQLNYGNPFMIKLANTSSSELFYKLKIFTENTEQNLVKIRFLCKENLGFIPQMEDVSEIIPDRNNIISIISYSYRNETLNRETKYKIIPINEKTKQTALWINPDHLNYLFSETFFMSLNE